MSRKAADSVEDNDAFEASLIMDPASGVQAVESPLISTHPELSEAESPTIGNVAPRQTPRDKWTGRHLSHYRLLRRVGSGSMGTVFQARDVKLDRVAALKVLPRQIAGISETSRVEIFLREARAAASIDHPNVAHIYEISEFKGWWFIAMEFLEGGNARTLVKSGGPLEATRASLLAIDAARGLSELHGEGLIHRDIKPSNLMLSRRGRCKLVDFGLVRFDQQDDPFEFKKRLVGTPLFMAPEIILQQEITPSVDVYSLGATIYFMLTGVTPFLGNNLQKIMQEVVEATPRPLSELAPATPPLLIRLVNQMMAKKPDERPVMDEVIAELQGLLAASSLADSSLPRRAGGEASFSANRSINIIHDEAKTPIWQDRRIWFGGGVLLLGAMGTYLATTLLAPRAPVVVAPAPVAQNETLWTQKLREIIPLRAEADARWERLEKINPASGLQELQHQAEVQRLQARAYFDSKLPEETLGAYDNLNKMLKNLETRLSAYDRMTLSQKSAQSKCDEFHRAGGASRLPQLETQLQNVLAAARQGGQGFDLQQQQWQRLEELSSQGLELLRRWQLASQARDALTQRLQSAQPALLEEFATASWRQVQQLQKQAETSTDPQICEQSYQQALQLLNQAMQLALSQQDQTQQRQRRNRQEQLQQWLSEAKSQDNPQQGQNALRILEKLLALDPVNAEALALQARIRDYYQLKAGQMFQGPAQIRLAYCPPGEFLMGTPTSEAQRDDDERQHPVRITRGFFMGHTEVTQAQWQAVMGKDFRTTGGLQGKDRSSPRFIGPELPVVDVAWGEAVEFCRRLSLSSGRRFRLPTEAEWEYACRGGKTDLPANLGEQANVDGPNGRGRIMPVASFKANGWGLFDMSGNVMEWCSDWVGDYPLDLVIDPTGPADGGRPEEAVRVVRGGSWRHPAKMARPGQRFGCSPVVRESYIGFRVLLEME